MKRTEKLIYLIILGVVMVKAATVWAVSRFVTGSIQGAELGARIGAIMLLVFVIVCFIKTTDESRIDGHDRAHDGTK
jgi:hypothetical protein